VESLIQQITARSSRLLPKFMETFFLAEEKHAIRVQIFHDLLSRAVSGG